MIATKASDVMGAEVEDERITWRKGWRREGVSNVRISRHSLRSARRRAKAEIRGLSCMLFPFFPRSPHLPASAKSSSFAFEGLVLALGPKEPFRGLGGVETSNSPLDDAAPPRIAATEECAHLACFRIDEVTVIHSEVTKAIGSTAMGIVRCGLRTSARGCPFGIESEGLAGAD